MTLLDKLKVVRDAHAERKENRSKAFLQWYWPNDEVDKLAGALSNAIEQIEALRKNKFYFDAELGQYRCVHCRVHVTKVGAIKHKKNCALLEEQEDYPPCREDALNPGVW